MNEIVVGDNGTILNLTINDDNGNIVDLRSASSVELVIKFRGIPIIKTATITDSINGKCNVTLTNSDIPNVGVYTIQTTVYFQNSTQFSSDIQSFVVGKNLRN